MLQPSGWCYTFIMVEFINKTTGTRMWVAESRVEEYKAAGHKLAAASPVPKEEEKEVKKPIKSVKRGK
jgi:hypothetical protein